MDKLYSYPVYQQIGLLMIVGSSLLCLFCAIYGSMMQRAAAGKGGGLPAPAIPGSKFPTVWDQLFNWVFFAFYAAYSLFNVTFTGNSESGEVSLAGILSTLVVYLPMIIRLACLPRPDIARRTFLHSLLYMPLALFIMAFLAGGMELAGWSKWVQDMTSSPQNQDVVELFMNGNERTRILIFLGACVVAPIGEECLFRGYIYNCLKGKCGIVAAALCSALFFGSVHGALVQLPLLTAMGLIQCYFYERFRTLWVPIAFHAIFNGLNLLVISLNVIPS